MFWMVDWLLLSLCILQLPRHFQAESMIQFNCPHCEHVYKINDSFAGKASACVKCKTKITVPAKSAPPIPIISKTKSTPKVQAKQQGMVQLPIWTVIVGSCLACLLLGYFIGRGTSSHSKEVTPNAVAIQDSEVTNKDSSEPDDEESRKDLHELTDKEWDNARASEFSAKKLNRIKELIAYELDRAVKWSWEWCDEEFDSIYCSRLDDRYKKEWINRPVIGCRRYAYVFNGAGGKKKCSVTMTIAVTRGEFSNEAYGAYDKFEVVEGGVWDNKNGCVAIFTNKIDK